MKIRSHSESHIVELEDGWRWQIFPGDLDPRLKAGDRTHCRRSRGWGRHSEPIGGGGKVRVRPVGESWPVRGVNDVLKDGW